MGFSFMGHGGYEAGWSAWERALELAEWFGWSPAGTVAMDYMQPYEDIPVDGEFGYFSSDGQLVTAADASAIAAALRRALADPILPNGSERDVISGLADYCEKGGFRIY